MNRSILRTSYMVLSITALLLAFQPCAVAQEAATQSVAGQYHVLYTFQGAADGAFPRELIRDAAGNLYGTAYEGGDRNCTYGPAGGCGVVFKLDRAGKQTVLYSFKGASDGQHPGASLIRDTAGNLYSTTEHGGHLGCSSGGGLGCGVVFRLDTTGKETVLYKFSGQGDGAFPSGRLIRDKAGNLYGVTQLGGDLNCFAPFGCGVVFKLDKTGKRTILHRFSGGSDGGLPHAGLIADASGNIYGTTSSGGDSICSCGLVFKLSKKGKQTVLYNFIGFSGGGDGADPEADLLLDDQGNLYGTTAGGGFLDYGSVFKLDKTGKETKLYSFTNMNDGAAPFSPVIRDAAGNLYGTTFGGGVVFGCGGPGCGAVFKLDTSGKETTLHLFSGGTDGGDPAGGLVRDATGNLYGTTQYGAGTGCGGSRGGLGCGVVFKITP
jgi:uncharacterized repeat protein (TIGR03803 family)